MIINENTKNKQFMYGHSPNWLNPLPPPSPPFCLFCNGFCKINRPGTAGVALETPLSLIN